MRMILHIIWDVVRCSLCFSTGYVLLTLWYPNVDSPVSLGVSWCLEDVERERILFQRSVKSEKKNNNCWIVFGCLIHIWCTPQAPQILSKFLHKTVKIYLLFDIYKGLLFGVVGSTVIIWTFYFRFMKHAPSFVVVLHEAFSHCT